MPGNYMFGVVLATSFAVLATTAPSEGMADTPRTVSNAGRHRVEISLTRQEIRVRAIRTLMEQSGDKVRLTPVVATGWESILRDAREAEIPVLLLDGQVARDPDLYLAAMDMVQGNEVAGVWLRTTRDGKPSVVMLQQDSTRARLRTPGFLHPGPRHHNIRHIRSERWRDQPYERQDAEAEIIQVRDLQCRHPRTLCE